MKKLYKVLVMAFLCSEVASAQVTYISSDFAVAGDSILVTKASIDSIGADNFQLTGTNYSWNYSNLLPLTQSRDYYLSAANTGYKLAYVTSCIAAGGGAKACNNSWNALVNLGHVALDSVSIGSFQFSNVVEQYFKSTGYLPINILGLTLQLNGLSFPLAIPYTIPDTVYRFPLIYGKTDSCTSKYSINLTSLGVNFIYKVQTKRVNDVEGWGALTTPYKNFASVIKLKTLVYNTDTLVLNGTVIPVPVLPQVIYSWFAPSEKIPALYVTGNEVSGSIIYTDITYPDTTRCLNPIASFTKSPSVIYLDAGTNMATVDFKNTAVNANTFEWNFGDAGSGARDTSSLVNSSHIYSAAGTYKVQLIAGNTLCSPLRYDTITIPVVVLDSTLAQAGFTYTPLQPCSGDTIVFTNTSLNSDTYLWSFGDNTVSSVKSPHHEYSKAGTYTVTLIAKNNTQTDTTMEQVVVSTTPVTTISPNGVVNSCADSVVLYASGGTYYDWSNGRVTDSIIVKKSGTYFVKAINSCGSDTSQLVTVNLNSTVVPTISISSKEGTSICSGTSVTFTATVTNGGATPIYLWKKNGTVVGTDSSSYTTNTLANNDIITCKLTSNNACATPDTITSKALTITVNSLPGISVSSISICSGSKGTLAASGANTYSWSPSTGLSATTGASVTANPTITSTYTITGTSAAQCSSTNTVVVTVNSLPVITSSPIAICDGSKGTLAAGGANTYSWAPSTGLSAITGASVTANPTITSTYTITGTNAEQCSNTNTVVVTVNSLPVITASPIAICDGSKGTLAAGGANTYSWAPSTGLSATTGASVTANPTITSTYTITGTNAAQCSNTNTVVVTVNSLPVITASPIAICDGSKGTLAAGGANTYSWAPSTGLSATTGASVTANPTITSTYTITGTNAAQCSNTNTVVVTVNSLPIVSVSPITICEGANGILAASGANSYTWSPSTGLSATTGALVTANPNATTTYTITGTSVADCINSATAIVTVSMKLDIMVNPISVCQGFNGVLVASGGSNYEWSPSTGLSATTGASVTASPTVTTTYTIIGSSGATCSDTTTTVVTILADSIPLITVVGNDTLISSPGSSYQWLSGNIAIVGDTSQTYIATGDGSYRVLVVNGNGCPDTSGVVNIITSSIISISNLPSIRIFPNPAQQFFTIDAPFTNYNLVVIDVTGSIVYEIKDASSRIKVDSENFPPGIYFVRVFNINQVLVQRIIIQK